MIEVINLYFALVEPVHLTMPVHRESVALGFVSIAEEMVLAAVATSWTVRTETWPWPCLC